MDLSLGQPLSVIQASKLFMNSEFRKGAEELVEELKKTGIDAEFKVGGLRQWYHLDFDFGTRIC